MGGRHYLPEVLSSVLHLLALPPVLQQPPELDVEEEDVLPQGPQLLLQQVLLVAPGSLVEGVLQGQAVHLQLFPPQSVEVVLFHLEQNREEAVKKQPVDPMGRPNPTKVLGSSPTVCPTWMVHGGCETWESCIQGD